MGIIHRDMAKMATEKFLAEPGGGEVLSEALNLMNSGSYTDLDIITQRDNRSPQFDIYDAYAVSQVRTMLLSGGAIHCAMNVHETPTKDQFHEENQRRLQRLPNPFTGRVLSDASDDGVLSWNEPILAFRSTIDAPVPWQVDPSRAPLEIGTTSASCTWWHLLRQGAVARWPYGSESIHLFIRLKKLGGISTSWSSRCRPWPSEQAMPANIG